jgi:hypothetical protein
MNSRPLLGHHQLALKDQAGGDLPEHLASKWRGQRNGVIGCLHNSPYNLYAYAKRYRFLPYTAAPTSGVSINRALADRIFPIPDNVRLSADVFVVLAAALIAELHSMPDVLAGYRIHGNNIWFATTRYSAAGKQSQAWVKSLEAYLNQKLLENGLLPVISFENSIHAWETFAQEGRWAKLSWQMLKLSLKERNGHTIHFALNTLKVVRRIAADAIIGQTARA